MVFGGGVAGTTPRPCPADKCGPSTRPMAESPSRSVKSARRPWPNVAGWHRAGRENAAPGSQLPDRPRRLPSRKPVAAARIGTRTATRKNSRDVAPRAHRVPSLFPIPTAQQGRWSSSRKSIRTATTGRNGRPTSRRWPGRCYSRPIKSIPRRRTITYCCKWRGVWLPRRETAVPPNRRSPKWSGTTMSIRSAHGWSCSRAWLPRQQLRRFQVHCGQSHGLMEKALADDDFATARQLHKLALDASQRE